MRFADAVRQSLGETNAGAPTAESPGPPRAASGVLATGEYYGRVYLWDAGRWHHAASRLRGELG